MKERPILFNAAMVRAVLDGSKTQTRRVISEQLRYHFIDGCGDMRLCPYGMTGDRLWVRESFWGCDMTGYGDQPCVVYEDEWRDDGYRPAEARPWARKFGHIPSIHMPRDCSRINLEITDVRVERLNSITESDCFAEGIDDEGDAYSQGEHYEIAGSPVSAAKFAYQHLWESINGPGSWDANPWVWVVSFKRVQP